MPGPVKTQNYWISNPVTTLNYWISKSVKTLKLLELQFSPTLTMQIHVRSSQNTKLPDIKASQNTKITGFPILLKHLTTGYPIYSPKSNSRHVLSDQAPTRWIFYPVKYIDSRSLNRYPIQSYFNSHYIRSSLYFNSLLSRSS